MNHAILYRRRWIALAGTTLQVCLGTVYAWSYFQDLLVKGYGWSNSQATWAFSLAICFLGMAAAIGGLLLPRFGPRRLAVTGGLLFGGGYLLAAAALQWQSLPLFYLGYGVIGGIGLGLGYVTPVATVAKWFPDKKGLATGMVIMGFGLGAVVMSKMIAPWLCALHGGNLSAVFTWLGLGFLVATVAAACVLRDPPEGFALDMPLNSGLAASGRNAVSVQAACLAARSQPGAARFACMWLVFFCNILAGISLISFQSPLIQNLFRLRDAGLGVTVLAGYGATLIALSSLFNGAGRMLWGGLSDRIGRVTAFRIMLAGQIAMFLALSITGNPWLFGGLVCCVLLCYGGGFGTIPALVLDTFGPKRMAVLYGLILTAWSAAGVVGPQLVALLRDHAADRVSLIAFLSNAVVLTVGLVATVGLKEHS